MNDKIKNIISICIIILFVILMIVYGVRKNKNNNTNQDNNNLTVSEENKVENNSNTTNKRDNKTNGKNENSQKENTSSKNSKIEAETISKVKSTFDESAFNNGHLESHPELGIEYATLIINKIKVNVPIFYGITEKGVGHDSESYFPGENSSIIMCTNNISKLGELKNGDIIEVKTNYGDFYYKKYDEQIIMETEKAKLPIQEEKEILMIYTSYPLENSNNNQYRYVVYAEKI